MAAPPEVGVSDFVLMDELNPDLFVDNLKLRFQQNVIYTYIGEVLVSVNPYKNLDIYGPNIMSQYRGREMFEVPPHVFSVADACQRVLRQQTRDTCVLISGESGAGKTEASKLIMKYIAANTTKVHREYIERVKNVLIQSNAILETFGNAKTNRNDNSSRFGKYMDIHFDYKGDPIGGHINNYLLEKSRVVSQQEGERNFHAFYQLLGGASDSQFKSWGFSRNDKFCIIGPNKPTSLDNKSYSVTNSAFSSLGFEQNQIKEIWTIVAGVILLGELKFSGDGSEMNFMGPIQTCCRNLGVTEPELKAVMMGRVLSAGGDLVNKEHTAREADYTRDALIKAIYDKLFTWIVQLINAAIEVPSKTGNNLLIGVLDIYGFEIFDKNSFEQFCINYCNEKLQQLFIELVLRQEQEEYQREGIQWTPIKYFNNRVICELVDAPHKGIIPIMDEACLNPKQITDQVLLEAFDSRLKTHPHYTSRQLLPTEKSLRHREDFRITHYAGDVTYSIVGFMDKNKDALWQDLKRLLYSSNNRSLSEMWPEGAANLKETSKRPQSASSLFRASLATLVAGLQTKEPFYVRCIKPNGLQSPHNWDKDLVRHQVAYLGLVENVRVRRAGFANRQRYDRFLKRYKMLSQFTWPNYRQGNDKEGVHVLLQDCKITDVQFGYTKLFIRSAQTLHLLEAARTALLPGIVILLQKLWRGTLARMQYRKMKVAMVILRAYRSYKGRIYIDELRKRISSNRKSGLAPIIWPAAPRGVPVQLLQAAYRRWRCYLILKPIPQDQWPQLKMKISAAGCLRKRRPEWGASRSWLGDYLAQPNYNSAVSTYIKNSATLCSSGGRPLFSCRIFKFNRYNKVSQRCLVVTKNAILKLDAKTFKILKKPIPIADVGVVRVMSTNAQLIVIGIPSTKNDIVVSLVPTAPGQDMIGELIGILANRFNMLRNADLLVEVEVGETTSCILGGKPRPLQLTSGAGVAPFSHARNIITYYPNAISA